MHCNGVVLLGIAVTILIAEVPSLDAFADHVHFLRKVGFLGANCGVAEVLVERALCELESEGDVVETSLFNLQVCSVEGHVLN